jgi:hypothetical protein
MSGAHIIRIFRPNNWWREKPVGDRDHEVLCMGSFGEYTQLYGK